MLWEHPLQRLLRALPLLLPAPPHAVPRPRTRPPTLPCCPAAPTLAELYNYEKFGTPYRRGQRYYYSHNSGLQNQYVTYSQSSLDGEPRVLIDPNTLSTDGTVALGGQAFSEDGALYAYMLSSGGSDWRTIYLKSIDQETGEATGGWVGARVGGWLHGWVGGWVGGRVGGWAGGWAGGREMWGILRILECKLALPAHLQGRPQCCTTSPPRPSVPSADVEGERLEHVKFSGITWTHDSKGFFYSRYEPPNTKDAGTETGINLGQQVRLGVYACVGGLAGLATGGQAGFQAAGLPGFKTCCCSWPSVTLLPAVCLPCPPARLPAADVPRAGHPSVRGCHDPGRPPAPHLDVWHRDHARRQVGGSGVGGRVGRRVGGWVERGMMCGHCQPLLRMRRLSHTYCCTYCCTTAAAADTCCSA